MAIKTLNKTGKNIDQVFKASPVFRRTVITGDLQASKSMQTQEIHKPVTKHHVSFIFT